MEALRNIKSRFGTKGLLLGIAGIWVMFFVVYIGLMGGYSLFTAAGMGIIAALMAFMVFIQ